MEKLLKSARMAYLKLCYAGLQEDMAQRIMFSILPHLADSSQVVLTNGVVDVRGLKAAVEGRTNIIKYGILSILDEMEHYRSRGEKSTPHTVIKTLLSHGDTESALDVAVKAFENTAAWDSRFGGRAWEMIAKTLRQIVRLDKTLNKIRASGSSADNQQQEIQVMRDLVVELNIFDGLAHNSDTIMNRMVELETGEHNQDSKTLSKEYRENYRKIKRLMDAKELDNPDEVFKQIRDTLTDSGDINKFKDWITKMRRRPEFFQTDPKRTEKLFFIYIRKAFIMAREILNTYRDSISSKIDQLAKKWDTKTFDSLSHDLQVIDTEIKILSDEFLENKNTFFKQYPELDDQSGHAIADAILDKPAAKTKNIVQKFDHLIESLELLVVYPDSRIPSDNERLKIVGLCKEILSLLNHLSYMLDGV